MTSRRSVSRKSILRFLQRRKLSLTSREFREKARISAKPFLRTSLSQARIRTMDTAAQFAGDLSFDEAYEVVREHCPGILKAGDRLSEEVLLVQAVGRRLTATRSDCQ